MYNPTTLLRGRQVVRSGPCWRAQVKPDGPIDSRQSESPRFDRLGVRSPNHQTLKLACELLKGQPVRSDTTFPQSGGLRGRRYSHARKGVPSGFRASYFPLGALTASPFSLPWLRVLLPSGHFFLVGLFTGFPLRRLEPIRLYTTKHACQHEGGIKGDKSINHKDPSLATLPQ
jgi:hypothetical protein